MPNVQESYYRGIVLHATNNTLVTRNVAYDVTGHCFYLEAGNEEGNELSYNLGSHVHPIGFAEDMTGQNTGETFEQDSTHPAVIPADIAASPFYFSNVRQLVSIPMDCPVAYAPCACFDQGCRSMFSSTVAKQLHWECRRGGRFRWLQHGELPACDQRWWVHAR